MNIIVECTIFKDFSKMARYVGGDGTHGVSVDVGRYNRIMRGIESVNWSFCGCW